VSAAAVSRRGLNWGDRFPATVAPVEGLRTIDGEVIACNGNGLAVFHLLRYRRP
jgi:ATP-dependent DNA ligase